MDLQTLENEVTAWRARFPQYEYRPQDECVALKLQSTQYADRAAHQPVACELIRQLVAALDAFERKERGILQAHVAAALVAELREAIDAADAWLEGKSCVVEQTGIGR